MCLDNLIQHQKLLRRGATPALTFDGELLHTASFPSAAVWWQAEAADAAACADAGAQDIVGVQVITTLTEERKV